MFLLFKDNQNFLELRPKVQDMSFKGHSPAEEKIRSKYLPAKEQISSHSQSDIPFISVRGKD